MAAVIRNRGRFFVAALLGLLWASIGLAEVVEIKLLALDEVGQRVALLRNGRALTMQASAEQDNLRFGVSGHAAMFELRMDNGDRVSFLLKPGESRRLETKAKPREPTPTLIPIEKKKGNP